MSAATLTMTRDARQPRPPDGLGIGAVLALLVHLLLIAALAFGVNWRAHEPEAVAAELWSAVPQIAAPRATSPPPAPTPPVVAPQRPAPVEPKAAETPRIADAQIAIERARREDAKRQADERDARRQEQQREAQKEASLRQKAEREKAAADEARRQQLAKEDNERRKKDLAEKARTDETALATQREANLKRIQGQADATGDAGSTGTAARSSGPSASYAGRIKARIKPNIVFTDSVSGNPIATVEVRLAPDGAIVSRKLVKSSGSSTWDESVLRAVDKTEMLPRDVDGRVPPILQIDFKPRD